MDFKYVYRLLLNRKWIIIGSAILAGVVAWYFTRHEQKTYRSLTQISTGFTVIDQFSLGSNQNTDFMAVDTKFSNVLVTMTSPTVINLLSYTLIIHDLENPHPFTPLKPEQKRSPLYTSVDQAKALNVFRENLRNMTMLNSFNPEEKQLLEFINLYHYDFKSISKVLNAFRLQRTDYIQIEYASNNPDLSAFVVNNLFSQFLRYYNTTRSDKSRESIDTLRSLMERKKVEFEAKNSLLKGEQPANSATDTRKYDQISNLERTLLDQKTKETTLQYDLRKINQRLADMGVGTQTQSVTPDNSNTNNELLTLRNAMHETYSAYVNGGSADKKLLDKYNSLKQQYQTKFASIAPSTPPAGDDKTSNDPTVRKQQLIEKRNDINLDIQAAESNITELEARLAQAKGSVALDASKDAAMENVIKEADQASKEYLAAKQRYNEALDFTSAAPSNFRQVLVGQPAIEPEPSKKLIIVVGATFGIFILGTLAVVLMAFLDATIRTPGIFSRAVNLKLISIINFMDLKQKSLTELVTATDLSYDPDDKQRFHNVFRESLRKLRYEIEKTGKNIFLFTSTTKGEGKTTLIQALSFSMSLSKKRILIIDTNFCNNDLTVKLEGAPILEKIIPSDRSDESLAEQVRSLSKDIGMGSVYIIGSQGGDYTPSEILPRKNLLHYLRSLTSEYDYIFLEGPPLNDFSDTRELTQYVDGVIAIFSADHVLSQLDKESMQYFRELNGKFCGAILNKVDVKMVSMT
jgi:succinoglycan biosynthesis transport protein ExoP